MQRRTKIFITIDVIAVLILIILLFLFLRREDQTVKVDVNTNVPPARLQLPINTIPEEEMPVIFTEKPETQAALVALAISFGERYGSFSSQSNFDNIRSLQSVMTDKMKASAENYKKESRDLFDRYSFYGVTLKHINNQIISLNESETQAQILVKMQKNETKGNDRIGTTSGQDLMITLIKADGIWKIDQAVWQ